MSASNRDPLDQALAKLPQAVTPKRDLWLDIEAQIEADGAAVESPRKRFTPHWYQMAAAVLLVIASSVTTYILVRGSGGEQQQPLIVESQPLRPQIVAMPASFAGQRLGEDYVKARASLDAAFEQRLALLPPTAREKVERNLTDIRVAAREIADTLAQHPSDPLLQELLLSTYQSELRLLADVTQMAPATATRVDL
jgi:hypothetical protein